MSTLHSVTILLKSTFKLLLLIQTNVSHFTNLNLLFLFSPPRLAQLRMDRENAEAQARNMEDQLAELQDELRKENNSKTVIQTVLNTLVNPHFDESKCDLSTQIDKTC